MVMLLMNTHNLDTYFNITYFRKARLSMSLQSFTALGSYYTANSMNI